MRWKALEMVHLFSTPVNGPATTNPAQVERSVPIGPSGQRLLHQPTEPTFPAALPAMPM
jgi:hypothetical protein